jgi:glycosyltransferase involved in cell wall biosynthesis
MARDKLLSVVIPCFNEAEVLAASYGRISAAIAELGESVEMVFVDDGSSDSTWPALRALAKSDPRVTAIKLSRNFGHQFALSAGIDHSTAQYVAVIDADLQDPPELLPRMLDLARQGNDVVYGKRLGREGETLLKRATANLFYRVLNFLSDTEIPRDVGDFRVMSRRVVTILRGMPERDRFVRGMVSWLGFRQIALEYDRDARRQGKTNYPFAKMLRLALTGISSFSIAPLRACIYLSYLLFLLSLAGIAYTVWAWYELDVVRGWASVTVLVMFLGGCNLFFTGVLGEYVGKTYFQTKMRPLYVVDEIVGDSGAPSGQPGVSGDAYQPR